jgi:membrane protein implicated in regulation of membrane protease activity
MILARVLWWIGIIGIGYGLVWLLGWALIFAMIAGALLTLFLICFYEYWRAKRRIEKLREKTDASRAEQDWGRS